MQIDHVYFPITSLGPNQRIGIWVRGCNRNCYNCSNPELQFFDKRTETDIDEFFESIKDVPFQGVTISGGEPFLQIKELRKLVQVLYEEKGIKDILIFTGFLKEELDRLESEDIEYIFSHIAVLIDGPYVEELHTELPLRGSSNQRVIFLNEEVKPDYDVYMSKDKVFDVKTEGHETYIFGIPLKDFREKYIYLNNGGDEENE